jgi:hypothetical protein
VWRCAVRPSTSPVLVLKAAYVTAGVILPRMVV